MIDAEARARIRPLQVALVLVVAVVVGVAVGIGVHLLTRPGSTGSGVSGASGVSGVSGASAASAGSSHGGLYGQATWAAGATIAPAITTLHDQSGRLFTLASLRGHTVAMTFFDSYCNRACPLEGRAIAAAERALPAARRPVLVVVSVNPRDTAASTRAAARRWGLATAGPWRWLRGTHAQLARVWKAYHIFVAPPSNGDIAHTEATYLIGRSGDERSAYVYPFATRFVSADLRTLAAERNS